MVMGFLLFVGFAALIGVIYFIGEWLLKSELKIAIYIRNSIMYGILGLVIIGGVFMFIEEFYKGIKWIIHLF